MRSLLVLAAACLSVAIAGDQEYFVSTLAGGVAPRMPAPARTAAIGVLRGLAIDSVGNVYVSSFELHCVFKIDTGGMMTRFAGTCRPGNSGDGGPASTAQLNTPMSLAVDAKDVVYIADVGNGIVRKVSRDGVITSLPRPPAREGEFRPQSIASDAAGNVYTVGYDRRIRRITPDGTVTTVAGRFMNSGESQDVGDEIPAGNAYVEYPSFLAVDGAGDLYIADSMNHRIRRISNGIISTVAGTGAAGYSGDGGAASQAQLSRPEGLTFDREGSLYVGDTGNSCVRKISRDGIITTFARGGTSAAIWPVSLAADPAGRIYMVDAAGGVNSGRLRRVDSDGAITTVAGNNTAFSGDGGPASQAQLYYPENLALDAAGNLYVADHHNWRVRKITPRGTISTVAGDGTCCAFLNPYGSLTVDGDGTVYITDGAHRIRKSSARGSLTTIAGTGLPGFGGDGGPAVRAQLSFPEGLAVDSGGALFVADENNHRVRKIAKNGTISTVAGTGTAGDIGDNRPAVEAQLYNPGELTVDGKGNLYILQGQSPVIRKVSPAGIITGVARIPKAQAITVDAGGTLYAVSGNKVIRISAEGRPEVIAGVGTGGYSGDGGPALDAEFGFLRGIAVDRTGKIYVSDAGNNAIRVLSLGPVLPLGTSAQEPSDLKVELRSATGSNRFRIGEEIPLEVALSSTTPYRYLEPCNLFDENRFGIPLCRFSNQGTFTVRPAGGWIDLAQGSTSIRVNNGPTIPMPNGNLTTQTKVFPYTLTHQFRFDAPGNYRVRLSLTVGLNDESTQSKVPLDPASQHSVTINRELVLEIVGP